MSTLINAAFHTIRSAQGMDSLRVTGKHVFDEDTGERVEPEVGVRVYSIPAIVPAWPSFWKEPRRHLRMKRAAKRHNRMLKRPVGKRLAELEAEAFLRGTGEL